MDVSDDVKRKIASMTLEEKIGQKIMLDFRYWNGPGQTKQDMTEPNDDVKSLILDNNIGGVILFSNNLKNTVQIKKLMDWYAGIQSKQGVRLLLGADNEGGDVFRLPRQEFSSFPGNMPLGAAVLGGANSNLAYAQGKSMAQTMMSLNINASFAPVVDVNTNPFNPVINVRSFSDSVTLVTELAEQSVAGMRSEKIIVAYKHYPGHGAASVDSHIGLPLVTRDRHDAFAVDIAPYKAAIDKGIAPDLIMTAHIQYPSLDSTEILTTNGDMIIVPATMSREIQTVILRDLLNFKGVTVSDALNMGAITKYFTEENAIENVFKAGVDIALMPIGIYSKTDIELLRKFIDIVVNKVKDGTISEAAIDASVERILSLKASFFLMGARVPHSEMGEAISALENEISDKSVTLLRNKTGELPIKSSEKKFFIFTPWLEQGAGIATALKDNGYSQVIFAKQGGITDSERDALIRECDVFVMGTMVADFNPDDPGIEPTKKLMIYAQNNLNKIVVHVSLRAPYDIVFYDYDIRNCLVTYARYGFENGFWRGSSMRSLGEILIGKQNPVGKLPVVLYRMYDTKNNVGVVAAPYRRGYGLNYNNTDPEIAV
ncbi:glycoside hydrolase family 3 protein [Phyllobacterium salinisoli]|uniref:beta-N-acetylhexosaminidase n=1 Tax=Phyllobacterium salinisoli TaxID=1899321 RepID=A0A368JXA2_9HYPH|nr:glycoside hydrolase family 3 protein [Phyllobacterium salinisoli]RCS21581.1 glycoside hydrolase family 3 protein [Phyllobacterium salinisoli]